MHAIHPLALFRLSVLGPLASREHFERGDLTRIIRELASHRYDIPLSKRVYLSEKTIERWYRLWQKGGVDALAPTPRCDRGQSRLAPAVQDAILAYKQENPKRSLDTLKMILEDRGLVARDEVKRSSIHRFLQQQGLSRPPATAVVTERRSFNARHAGDLWCGDVMHGPRLMIDGQMRKVYLVSLMDDASRLLTHSAFCLGETALEIEGVLKQALLRRGLPVKLVVDNGAAYRAKSLQGICARLEIRLIYCRPFDPESKGKLERFHRVFRQQFLTELNPNHIRSLADLNARLWVWVETLYHHRPHSGLEGLTPLQRYQQDLLHIRPLGGFAQHLDDLFYHRLARQVRKDGTVSYAGQFYEVPYELVGQRIQLVVDPQSQRPIRVESMDGQALGGVTPLDRQANNQRTRQRPPLVENVPLSPPTTTNVLEHALQKQSAKLALPPQKKSSEY